MDNRLRHITIVGGGTSGWLTAAFLITTLKWAAEGEGVAVTLIESPRLPTIGVGEATVPSMSMLLRQLRLDEAEFMRRCNASFKLGVRLSHWNEYADGAPRDYFHPFNTPTYIRSQNPGYYFHRFVNDPHVDFADASTPNVAVVANRKGPRLISDKPYHSWVGYAYHLDATLFADYLREISIERGVEHILDDVVDVGIDERGFVSHLDLKEQGRRPIELVIDCSGFHGLILRGALKEPFISHDKRLLCDKALAVQIPHEDPTALDAFTSSTALGAGWVWNVPLYNRVGTGYVFSSAFRSEAEATDELLAHLGPRGKGAEPRLVDITVGRAERSWVKNCIAIGLSSGFIEPLESTAIYMIETAVRWIMATLPDKTFNPVVAGRFNKLVGGLQDEVRDFIVAHYYLSNRAEPFWQAARSEIDVPDSLLENLEFWKHALPSPLDCPGSHLFNHWNYQYVLAGKGYFDGREFPVEALLAEADWQRYSDRLNKIKASVLSQLPDHHELITMIRNGEAARAAEASAQNQPYTPRSLAEPQRPSTVSGGDINIL